MGFSVEYIEGFGQDFETLERLRIEHGLNVVAEDLAWEHCRMSNNGISDWVQFLHGIDSFLFSAQGLLLPEILQRFMKHSQKAICGMDVQTARFGGQRTTVEYVAEGQSPIPHQFLLREPNLTESWHVSEILVRPAVALYASNHRLLCDLQSETHAIPQEMLRSNHYFDTMQARCSTCSLLYTEFRDT